MALDYDKLKNWSFAPVEQRYTWRETALYALGIGLGHHPEEIDFVYEKRMKVLPTMAFVLAVPGFWTRDPALRLDWRFSVDAERELLMHRPLPPEATVRSRMRVTHVIDKGAGKGAMIRSERDLVDVATEETIATLHSTGYLRRDGGFGDRGDRAPAPPPRFEGDGEAACVLPVSPRAALIYRLSGDENPLHADPDAARTAGFPRPILHGLCTLGMACHAVLKTFCNSDPARMKRLRARFTAPVFPGETLRFEFRRDGDELALRAVVPERDGIVVLDHARAELLS
jgi:acyl dehydratase